MDMPTISKTGPAAERAAFYARLAPERLSPLWEVLGALVPKAPTSPAVSASWSFDRIRPLLMEAGDLITAQEAERRVLILENPALAGQSRITSTLYAGLQLIMPGEVAPAHRHSQNALRFVMDGDGAFTALDGERAYMHRYDLVLTPGGVWHDHGNETDRPMIWLDGLDIPLVQSLDAGFAEHRHDRGAVPMSRPAGDATLRWGRNLRPARRDVQVGGTNPLFVYAHADWRETLETMRRAADPHPHDGYRMEFANPRDGGPVLTTISAFATLVPGGVSTRAMRSSDGMIHVVTEGRGTLAIGDERYAVSEGDIVVAPSWSLRSIDAAEDLVLFSYSDKATQEKLSLWREDLL